MSLATAGTVFSIVSAVGEFQAGRNQAKAQEIASEQRARELRLQEQAAKTRAAQEEFLRQEQLTKVLAAQRAAYGAAGVDASSGSPLNIQQQAGGQTNRASRIASLNTDLETAGLRQQSLEQLRAGQIEASATRASTYTTGFSRAGSIVTSPGFESATKRLKID